jgi:hypothetical protein
MSQRRSFFLLGALLVMGLGLAPRVSAGEIAAPDLPPPWLTEESDPAMMDDGMVGDGDMRKRSTGVCIAHFNARDNKRYYSCDYPTSEDCVDSRMTDVGFTRGMGARRFICPAPNPS